MNKETVAERIAVIETEFKNMHADMAELKESQQEMMIELTRYKGAFGLLSLFFSAFVALGMIFREKVISFFN